MANNNNFKKLILLFFLLIGYIYGNGPEERYHITCDEFKNLQHQNIKGILTVNTHADKIAGSIKIYSLNKNKFHYEKSIVVLKETIPVSNYGYGMHGLDGKTVHNFRFPILDTLSNYYLIVYDCKKNLQAWIDIKDVNKSYGTKIVMMDNLVGSNKYYIDLFYCNDRKINIYKKPDINFELEISLKDYAIKVINQKGNWIEIAYVGLNHDTYEYIIEPIGWIEMKNEKNQIIFWIKYIDFC
ncbi:MAG: hypothetical protein GY932_00925 [Arcobacter sp.]|nr:hypothetical protein [Arcobacter sp.]